MIDIQLQVVAILVGVKSKNHQTKSISNAICEYLQFYMTKYYFQIQIIIFISSWGYCDDGTAVPKRGSKINAEDHKYFEVETTVLPNDECGIRSSG